VVGDYHTHGNYSIEIAPGKFIVTGDPARDNLNSDKFSVYDVRRYQTFQKMLGAFRGYLGTPSGKFYVYVNGKYYDLAQVIKALQQQQEEQRRREEQQREEQKRKQQEQQKTTQ
jgi:hypothetical protein